MTEDELKEVAAQVTAESQLRGEGGDEERARIVAYLRKAAENSTEADTLIAFADYIEAGLHWEDGDHDED